MWYVAASYSSSTPHASINDHLMTLTWVHDLGSGPNDLGNGPFGSGPNDLGSGPKKVHPFQCPITTDPLL